MFFESTFYQEEVALLLQTLQAIPRGLTARILGSHPRGPGSTPGVGILL